MRQVSDEDLVLLSYGEHDDPELAARVARDPELSARLDALTASLGRVEHATPPDPGPDFGERTWQRLVPRLAAGAPRRRGWRWLSPASLAGTTALVVVAVVAFWAGRESQQLTPSTIQTERLLATRVTQHLLDAERLLTSVANDDEAGVDGSPANAAALLASNRIVRAAVEARGDDRLADVLRSLERALVQLANDPSRPPMLDDGLLFRVRMLARRDPRQFENRFKKETEDELET